MILFTHKKRYNIKLLFVLIMFSLFTGKVIAQCDYSDDFKTLPAPTSTAFSASYLITATSTAGWVCTNIQTVKGPDTGVTGSTVRTKYKEMKTGEQGFSMPGYTNTGYHGYVVSPTLMNGCDSITFNYASRGAALRKLELRIKQNGIVVWRDTLNTTVPVANTKYQYTKGKIGIAGSCTLTIDNIYGASGSDFGYDLIIWNVCIQKVSKITTPAFTVVGKTNTQNLYLGSAKVAIACKTQGVNIYYTTDGTAPTTSSTLYTDSIALSATSRIKAIAAYSDLISEVADTLLTFADQTAPTVPTDLTGTPAQTAIDLSWTASTDNVGVAGYNIYANGELQGTATKTNYTLSGLTPATEYIVDVEAFDAAGNKSAKATTTISTLSVTTNLSEPENNEISVYPNPIKDYVNISITENSQAIITDLSGKILISTVLNTGNNRVNTSALPSGVFLLKVGNKVNKLMK